MQKLESNIVSLVKDIANRMRDPNHLKQVVYRDENINKNSLLPNHTHSLWDDFSLASGASGVVFLFAELDQLFPEEKWDAAAHAYILKIKEHVEKYGVHQLSLFGGLSGACLAIHKASRNGTRYQRLIETFHTYLLQKLEQNYFVPFNTNLTEGKPSPVGLYDIIQGIAGIGIYMLSQPGLIDTTEQIVRLLIRLTKPIQWNGAHVEGWFLPSHLQPTEERKQIYPQGSTDVGLAHGIAGVLAFLAAAMTQGIELEGHRAAIQFIVDWLQSKRHGDAQTGYTWPDIIPLGKNTSSPTREGWCYGTPGINWSLFLASKALQQKSLADYVIESLQSVFKRDKTSWRLPGPTMCHGYSGFLHILQTIAAQTGSQTLQSLSDELLRFVMGFYNSEFPLGFKDSDLCKDGTYAPVDRPGLLEGTSGILLTLLKTQGASPFLVTI